METAIFTIALNDGRGFHVFCANRAQKQRFFRAFNRIPEKFAAQYATEINGIHDAKQWENIVDYLQND